MYKKTLSACALLLSGMTAAYAGTMGEVDPLPVLIPFVAGEGLYSWPEVDGFNLEVLRVGTFTSQVDKSGWGGRLAVGAIHPFTETWAGSAEVGWGYYGSINMDPGFQLAPNSAAQITATGKAFKIDMEQYGFDVLAGVFYMKPKYDLFFKAGALVQNLRLNIKADPTQLAGDNQAAGLSRRLPGQYKLATTMVNALPELKVGGMYHINKDWLVSLSWMHAFGSELSVDIRAMTVNPVVLGSTVAQIRVPTIDVFLFGLEYRFA